MGSGMTTLSRRAEIGAGDRSRGLVLGWLLGVRSRHQLPCWFILGLLWGPGFLAAPLGLYGDAYYRITLPVGAPAMSLRPTPGLK